MRYIYSRLIRLLIAVCSVLGLQLIGRRKVPSRTILGLRTHDFRTIIDVGANTGQFSRYVAKFFPKARLICFEPLPVAFATLKAWATKQQTTRVELFNMAIGDSEGQVEMFHHTAHSPSSSLLATTAVCHSMYPFSEAHETVTVPLTTLDSFFAAHDHLLLGDLLIKLDVQGYEDRVIRGGRKIFLKAKAVILEVCLDALYEKQATFKDIVNLMAETGLVYAGNLEQHYADDGHVVFFDAIFVRVDHDPR